MGLFGFVKDVVLLPLVVVLDVTLITPGSRIVNGTGETPFGTFDRLESMVKNLDDTRK